MSSVTRHKEWKLGPILLEIHNLNLVTFQFADGTVCIYIYIQITRQILRQGSCSFLTSKTDFCCRCYYLVENSDPYKSTTVNQIPKKVVL